MRRAKERIYYDVNGYYGELHNNVTGFNGYNAFNCTYWIDISYYFEV